MEFRKITLDGDVRARCACPGKLYRFELAFDGEPQGVGLLTGLDATGLPPGRSDRLVAMFDDLALPEELGTPVRFWFTQAGILRFADAVAEIMREIEPHGWTVLLSVMERKDAHELYADEYQVAVPSSSADQEGSPL